MPLDRWEIAITGRHGCADWMKPLRISPEQAGAGMDRRLIRRLNTLSATKFWLSNAGCGRPQPPEGEPRPDEQVHGHGRDRAGEQGEREHGDGGQPSHDILAHAAILRAGRAGLSSFPAAAVKVSRAGPFDGFAG